MFSFKDIRKNEYHIETMNEGNKESLYITSMIYGKNIVAEKLPAFSSGLYHTTIKPIESYVVMNQKFNDPKCDAPIPGSPVDHRQPAKNLCVSYHETHT